LAALSSRHPAYSHEPSSTVARGRNVAAAASVQPRTGGHEPSSYVAAAWYVAWRESVHPATMHSPESMTAQLR